MKILAHFRTQLIMIVYFLDMLEALVPVSHLPLLVLLVLLEYYKLLGKTKFIQEWPFLLMDTLPIMTHSEDTSLYLFWHLDFVCLPN